MIVRRERRQNRWEECGTRRRQDCGAEPRGYVQLHAARKAASGTGTGRYGGEESARGQRGVARFVRGDSRGRSVADTLPHPVISTGRSEEPRPAAKTEAAAE